MWMPRRERGYRSGNRAAACLAIEAQWTIKSQQRACRTRWNAQSWERRYHTHRWRADHRPPGASPTKRSAIRVPRMSLASPDELAGHKRKRNESTGAIESEDEEEEHTHARKRGASARQSMSIMNNRRNDDDVPDVDDDQPVDQANKAHEEEDVSDDNGELPAEEDEEVEKSVQEDEDVPVDNVKVGPEEDDEDEAAARTEDERESRLYSAVIMLTVSVARKKAAMDAILPLEKMFAVFRDKYIA
ncbi:hypothetical protein MRB53_037155 [Persea americana]|nr:hypothetical protein MRB53_037155 [Persea americana]